MLRQVEAPTFREYHEQKRSNNVSGAAVVHFHRTPAQPLGFWQEAIRFHDGKRIAGVELAIGFIGGINTPVPMALPFHSATGECVLSQSRNALSIRVCQPRPVARNAASTSGL